MFKFNKGEDDMFGKLYGSQHLDTYEDYSKLLSKQMGNTISDLIKAFD